MAAQTYTQKVSNPAIWIGDTFKLPGGQANYFGIAGKVETRNLEANNKYNDF